MFLSTEFLLIYRGKCWFDLVVLILKTPTDSIGSPGGDLTVAVGESLGQFGQGSLVTQFHVKHPVLHLEAWCSVVVEI